MLPPKHQLSANARRIAAVLEGVVPPQSARCDNRPARAAWTRRQAMWRVRMQRLALAAHFKARTPALIEAWCAAIAADPKRTTGANGGSLQRRTPPRKCRATLARCVRTSSAKRRATAQSSTFGSSGSRPQARSPTSRKRFARTAAFPQVITNQPLDAARVIDATHLARHEDDTRRACDAHREAAAGQREGRRQTADAAAGDEDRTFRRSRCAHARLRHARQPAPGRSQADRVPLGESEGSERGG